MNGGQVQIVYDGDGARVAKTIGGATAKYLVDELSPTGFVQVVEELVNGAVQRKYTHGYSRISQNRLVGSTWMPSFYGYDASGSVRFLTDISGTVTDTYDYDAWGNAVNVTGSTLNLYLYRGEQYDADLGLYYLRARYFNPLTGRFLTIDPEMGQLTNVQTLHNYQYAGGDPVNRIDPTGKAFLFRYGSFAQHATAIVMTLASIYELIACTLEYVHSLTFLAQRSSGPEIRRFPNYGCFIHEHQEPVEPGDPRGRPRFPRGPGPPR